jgi:DNA-binding transcriptional ArsR family regulator
MKEPNSNRRQRRKCELKVALLGALAFDKRLEILELLRNGELCEQEIAEQLEMGQSAISRHLQCLRRAGLVSVRHQGVRRCYSLQSPKILDLLADTDELLRAIWQTQREAMKTTHKGELDSLGAMEKGKHND